MCMQIELARREDGRSIKSHASRFFPPEINIFELELLLQIVVIFSSHVVTSLFIKM